MCASVHGHTKVAQLILSTCSNPQQLVNLSRRDGVSSLMLASQDVHTETASLLLQNGAHVNAQASNGVSSLMLASKIGAR